MKQLFSTLIILAIAIQTHAQKVTIAGALTVTPITKALIEAYNVKNPKVVFTINEGNSTDGANALIAGSTDMIQMGRKLTETESGMLSKAGKRLMEIPIAIDAVAVVVHPSNKVFQLTREQLEDIYTGKITNWKEVGGDDVKIILYVREESAAIAALFKSKAILGKPISPKAGTLTNFDDISDRLELFKGAIGYVSLMQVGERCKALNLSFDGGKNYYSPSMENVKSEAYPLSRTLYYAHLDSSIPAVRQFVDYTTSRDGQRVIIKLGFAPSN